MYLLSKLFGIWFHFTNHNIEHPHSNRVRRLEHCIFERIEHTPKLLNVSLTFLISRRLFSSFERRIKKAFLPEPYLHPVPVRNSFLIVCRIFCHSSFTRFLFYGKILIVINVRRTFFLCAHFSNYGHSFP